MTSLAIDDPDDARLADYRAVRERDLVGRQGRFIAEGEQVVRVLLAQSRYAIRSLLVTPPRLEALFPLVPRHVPIYCASTEVLSTVVGFHIHRGVLAAADVGPPATVNDVIANASRVLVLESITNHDNVGGLFRNAAAFGIDAVLIDEATCDPLYRKAIRVSVGGALRVPFARYSSTVNLLAMLRTREHAFTSLAMTPRADATPLTSLEPSARWALWLGTEGAGLSVAALAGCDRAVTIPMAAGFDSLNVATAAGIALYALTRP